MKILTIRQAMQVLAKATGKYCMYISIYVHDIPLELQFDEMTKAAPYLNFDEHTQILCEETGILMFDTREEMDKYYKMTIGDDGPTELNKYDGLCRIYALTCDNQGNFENENT